MSALHVFDMDGTLLRGTTASLEISRRLDRLEPLHSLEERFATEEITAAEFAVATRDLWHDLSPGSPTSSSSTSCRRDPTGCGRA